jgi:hypothetical protein
MKGAAMKNLFFPVAAAMILQAGAQNNTTTNIIEGGKVVVDIIKAFKSSKNNLGKMVLDSPVSADSCATKFLADICYMNETGKTLTISLYKRNGNLYATAPLTLTILSNSKECIYEIQAGIYKYKIEYSDNDKAVVLKSGEIKLQSCDKKTEEVKN